MPTYMFICPLCEHIQQTRVQEYEVPVVYCEKCLEEVGLKVEMERKISGPNVIYKGDGFYVTDYKIRKPDEEWDG